MIHLLLLLFTYLNRSKRVSCLIVRGTTFSPSALKWVSNYLQVPLTNFIMGKLDKNYFLIL